VVYVKEVRPQLRTLDDHSTTMIFIGYDERIMGLLHLRPGEQARARDARCHIQQRGEMGLGGWRHYSTLQ